VLRRTFGSKGDEVMGGWRKLHNSELHDFYSSPNRIKMIKLRRMRLVGHGMGISDWWERQRERTTRKTKA
jgi:hypothetical protein